MVNTCWHAIDRHVAAGHGDRLAIIHDSPMTGAVLRLTYAQLQDRLARLAGVLTAHGIGKGDRVIIKHGLFGHVRKGIVEGTAKLPLNRPVEAQQMLAAQNLR